MFAPTTYVHRRARLCDQVTSGLILFLGNEESPMNFPDNPYPFRQDSSFLYYWGLDTPGLAATLNADTGEAVLYGTEKTLDDVVWMGRQPTLTLLGKRVEVERVRPPERLDEQVAEARRQGRRVHVLPPYRAANTIRLTALLGVSPGEVSAQVSDEFIAAVVAQRSIKSAEEVEEIEAALAISRDLHVLAMRRTRPGILEQEVVGAMEGLIIEQGSRVAYPIIFSIHGEVLHNHVYTNRMPAGKLAVNDAGATSPRQYASDITRTLPVDGRFTTQQREIYDLVLGALDASIEAVRPGVPYRDVHLQAARYLAEGLKALGLMRGDVDEAVQAGAHALFFPHGLGHMMGLDVHDMEDLGEDVVGYGDGYERSEQFGLRSLRLARPLRPGFVLTVEPGLYFIPPLIDLWEAEQRHIGFIDYEQVDAYRAFGGVRIEDNVLVTDNRHRVLGPPIPRTADEVEAEMGQTTH